MPIVFIPRLIFTLISWIILGAAIYLLWSWNQGYLVVDPYGAMRHVRGPDWRLYAGCVLLAWSFLGRFVVLMTLRSGKNEPRERRGEAASVRAPDGSTLRLDRFGPAGAPEVILTHGWGLNSTAWWYTVNALSERFRLVTWDLPGLGKSKAPADRKITIDRFAEALGAVVEAEAPSRVVLVGHSIGGMTTQTFWRACPDTVKSRVAGIVLVDTTYEDPIQTMWLAPLWRALRWPLIEPLMWLTILLWPIAWLSSWQSYLSGSNQIAMRLTGFGRYPTRGQVDFNARLACKGPPNIQAKGNLAMFRWSAAEVLPSIPVPTLVLAGSKDIVTLPRASEIISKDVPRARMVQIEGGGHMGFMERADAYNAEIARFLDEVFAQTGGAVASAQEVGSPLR